MKKILHISNYFPPHIGGIEKTAYDIVKALCSDYEQKVICFNNGDGKTYSDNMNNVEIIRVSYLFKIASQAISFTYLKVLKKCLNTYKPDIIHIHLPNPLIVRYLNKCDFRGIIIIHHHLDIIKQRVLKVFIKRTNKKLYDKAKLIIATSVEYSIHSKELKPYLAKVKILNSAIDEKSLELNENDYLKIEEIKRKYTDRFTFFIGRHVKYKGLKYLLRVAKTNEDRLFLIAGNGPLTSRLKRKAKCPNIVFLGRLTEEEKRAYLASCYVFCFPSISKNEAFGLSLAEALYFGKPAITFKIKGSGVNYVNKMDYTGLEVPLKSVLAFSKAIKLLYSDKDLYDRLSLNAKKRTSLLFTSSSFMENIKQIYQDLEKDGYYAF